MVSGYQPGSLDDIYGNDSSGCLSGDLAGGTIAANTWTYVVAAGNKFYVNGSPTSGGGWPATRPVGVTNLRIGTSGNGGMQFNGQIDELRVAFTNRSDSWIATEYNNQNAPGTFYTIGAQQ
jgi:hypothetical protein